MAPTTLLALRTGFHLGGPYPIGMLFLGAALAVAVIALSHEQERSFSAAAIYVALGGIAAGGLALLDLHPFDPVRDHALLERLAELALVVAVFSAGISVERNVSRRSWISISVLLAVVMPLTIAAVAVFGTTVMGLSLGASVLLGAIVAPTDPVLAGDVGLGPPGSDEQGEPRLSLHTEAGINDGLASPFILLGVFVASRKGVGWLGEWGLADVAYGVGVAVALGLAAGSLAAAGLARARDRDLFSRHLDGFSAIALVLMVYGLTEALGAYGLLAVFAAGFAFRRREAQTEVNVSLHHGTEVSGTFLELLVLLLLGSMLTTDGLGAPGWAGWGLAVLLLFVIRPVLVFATSGRRFLPIRERAFLAFFGVRGVAALFYAAVVVNAHVLGAGEERVVVWTAIACVVLSILVHGTTATPLTRRLLRGPCSGQEGEGSSGPKGPREGLARPIGHPTGR